MQRVRVTQLIARMNVGGPAVQVSELVTGLDPLEFDVRLVTGWCDSDEADYIFTQAPDIEAIRLADLGRSVRTASDVRALAAIVRDLRRFRPHVLHTHTAKAGALGRVAARISGTRPRVVHTYHGHLLTGYFDAARTRTVVETERFLARTSDRLVTVGQRVRDDLLAAGVGRPGQYQVILPGVRRPRATPPAQARAALGLPADRVTIAVVGRLARIKRPDRMVDVVTTLVARGLPVHVVVAGDGGEAAGLARAAAAKRLPITVLGWRADPEVALSAADFVLLTSDNEGVPVCLIEASWLGVPAVATRVGSVPEVVNDEVTGLLASPSAGSLTVAAERMVVDADLRRRLGAAAREHADRFGTDRYVAAHAALYRSLLP